MKETVQEYIQRIRSKVSGKDPLRVQASTPKQLADVVKRATPAKLRKRPAPDKWSAAEILAHLADAEVVASWRLRAILGAPDTPIQSYDQESWAAAGRYDKRDPHKSLELFRVLREANIALLKSLSPEQWKHSGMHDERGPESIERLTQMMAGHDLNHLEQVEALLSTKPRT
jgi:hypothetical protein